MHTLAAVAVLVAAATTVLMDWVPTPLNRNIEGMTARERLPSTLVHGGLGLAFAAANALAFGWGILAGAVWYSVVLAAAVNNWWVPYFAGVHRGEVTPEVYARHYARNPRVLPPFRGHPVVPDAQHTLIHATVLASCALSWWSFLAA